MEMLSRGRCIPIDVWPQGISWASLILCNESLLYVSLVTDILTCALMLFEKFWMIFPGIYEIAAFCYFTSVRNSAQTRDDLLSI